MATATHQLRTGDAFRFAGGDRALPRMTNAFIQQIGQLADEHDQTLSRAEHRTADEIVSALVTGLHNSEVWQRLHPLSPLIRSWKIVAAAAVILFQQGGDRMARGEGLPDGLQRTITLGLFGAVVLVGLAFSVLSWRMSSYSIDRLPRI